MWNITRVSKPLNIIIQATNFMCCFLYIIFTLNSLEMLKDKFKWITKANMMLFYIGFFSLRLGTAAQCWLYARLYVLGVLNQTIDAQVEHTLIGDHSIVCVCLLMLTFFMTPIPCGNMEMFHLWSNCFYILLCAPYYLSPLWSLSILISALLSLPFRLA